MENGPSLSQTPVEPAGLGELPDLTGRELGDFVIRRKLGQGGMGEVYLAEQQSLKRPVALKILRPELAANPLALKRFQAEAEAVARVTHANIVQVYAIGQSDGLHFMALEYVEGRNLRDYLSRKGVPDLPLALGILTQTTAALIRAAESGIVHRDIKPENILLTRQGEVKVADFGLSRCLAADRAPLNLTQSGVSLGTPLYMSPEQVQGQEVDPRSDIYSLGVTAYHLLAGEPPFRGQTAFDVAVQHVQKEPAPLATLRPDLPAEVCAVVHKMMAKDPAKRYQSARELLADLEPLRAGLGATGITPALSVGQDSLSPPRRSTRRWLLAGAAALLLAAFAAGLGVRWWQGAPAQAVVPPEEPVLSMLERREQALKAAVARPINPRQPEQLGQHFESTVELGVLYLDSRQLDKAQVYFQKLREAGSSRLYQAFGRIGQACVLAFQDRPRESNELFLEVERVRPQPWLDKGRPPGPRTFRPSWKGSLDYPELMLLGQPDVRRLIVEALNHNAVNLGVASLPEPLERLRRPPGPPGK